MTLNVPSTLRTPTTGVAVASQTAGARRITTYVAHHVRDFEWAAGRLATVRGRSGDTRGDRVLPAARRDATGCEDRSRVLPQVVEHLCRRLRHVPVSGDGRRPHRLRHLRRDGVSDDHLHEPGQDHDLARARAPVVVRDRGRRRVPRRRGSTSRSPRGRRYLPFGGTGRSARRYRVAGVRLRGSRTTWRTGTRTRHEYDIVYGGGGCLLGEPRPSFGLVASSGSCTTTRRTTGRRHAHGGLQAAIEAAATADGVAFDRRRRTGPPGGWTERRPSGVGFASRFEDPVRRAPPEEGRAAVTTTKDIGEPARQGAAVLRVLAARPPDRRPGGDGHRPPGGNRHRARGRARRRPVHHRSTGRPTYRSAAGRRRRSAPATSSARSRSWTAVRGRPPSPRSPTSRSWA